MRVHRAIEHRTRTFVAPDHGEDVARRTLRIKLSWTNG